MNGGMVEFNEGETQKTHTIIINDNVVCGEQKFFSSALEWNPSMLLNHKLQSQLMTLMKKTAVSVVLSMPSKSL